MIRGLDLFGTYEDFPDTHHSITRYNHEISTEKLQLIIIESLYRLNQDKESPNFPEFNRYNIKVEIELGIADGLIFNYLNEEVLKYCREITRGHLFPTLDFLCVICYYIVEEAKRKALRFDYHLLRFLLNKKKMEIQVYHEKGIRRLPIVDLINFLVEEINQELARERLNPIKISYMRSL